MKAVARINPAQFSKTNNNARCGEITPEGISREAVRSLAASISRSRYRLKAIAALRAITIHISTRNNFNQISPAGRVVAAMVKPTKANGSAKTVWLNFIRDR